MQTVKCFIQLSHMLRSFQNSNFFQCPCKANETQLLERSAKRQKSSSLKHSRGENTHRKITPKMNFTRTTEVSSSFSMVNSKSVPASQRSNKAVPPQEPGERQGFHDSCIIVRNINDTHMSRSEEAKFTGSSPSFPRQVCWGGKKEGLF